MFIRFDRIHERDGQTDGWTERQTPQDGTSRAYAQHRAAINLSVFTWTVLTARVLRSYYYAYAHVLANNTTGLAVHFIEI